MKVSLTAARVFSWMGFVVVDGWLFVLFVEVSLVAGWFVDAMDNGFFDGWMGV